MLKLAPHDMSIMGGLCGKKINVPIWWHCVYRLVLLLVYMGIFTLALIANIDGGPDEGSNF